MIVTINTDASHHSDAKIGGYAFWIVCNEFRIVKSGALKNKCARPEIAEFMCIINAVHLLFQSKPSKITKVVVNTDCLNVIHLLKGDKNAIRKYGLETWGAPLVKIFYKIAGDTKFEFRHIRSHQHTNTPRNWVNDWCDKEAKKAMWDKVNSVL